MNFEQHLSSNQIYEYRRGSLRESERRDVERHLLRCPECRAILPKPTEGELLMTVFTENSAVLRPWTSGFGVLDFIRPLLLRPAFTALLLAVAALSGVSILLLTNRYSSVDDSLVAINTPVEKAPIPDIFSDAWKNREDEPASSVDTSSNKHREAPARTPVIENRQTSKSKRSNDRVVSETRGSKPSCETQTTLIGKVRPTDEEIELSWGKVSDAVKFNVYVADLDERLVEEFETTDQKVRLAKNKLENEIKYQWKILTTLKDGRSVVNVMQTFTKAGLDEAGSNGQMEKRSVGKVRCVNKN